MQKSLDRALLDTPRDGDEELKMEDDNCPMDVLKRISQKLSLDAYFNGIGANAPMITKNSSLHVHSPESTMFVSASTQEDSRHLTESCTGTPEAHNCLRVNNNRTFSIIHNIFTTTLSWSHGMKKYKIVPYVSDS
jgi:hypothetical protein